MGHHLLVVGGPDRRSVSSGSGDQVPSV